MMDRTHDQCMQAKAKPRCGGLFRHHGLGVRTG